MPGGARTAQQRYTALTDNVAVRAYNYSPHDLHRPTRLASVARLMLVVWLLSLGVAFASPWVQPQNMQLICSGAGPMKLLVQAEDGSAVEVAGGKMDCPLCTPAGAPPSDAASLAAHFAPVARATHPSVATHAGARTAAPPPGRGPPARG